MESDERLPSDTAGTQRHILAIVFNHHRKRILQLTIQSLITLHLTTVNLSSLVRILRMWRACDAQKFNNKRQ